MSLTNILKPYTFANNTETADATKVNADLDVLYSGVNNIVDWTKSQSSYLATVLTDHVTRAISSSTSVLANDNVLLVDATSGAVNLSLLSAAGLISLSLVVVKTDSGANPVNLNAYAGDTIMGQSSISLSLPGESIRIVSYNQQWWRIG
jgi:hypothetical protein